MKYFSKVYAKEGNLMNIFLRERIEIYKREKWRREEIERYFREKLYEDGKRSFIIMDAYFYFAAAICSASYLYEDRREHDGTSDYFYYIC